MAFAAFVIVPIASVRSAPVQSLTAAVGVGAGLASPVPSVVKWSIPLSARPAAPPMMGGTMIYLVLESGHVAAYRLSDGGVAWRVDLRSDQRVAVETDRVFVTSGEALYALNAATGSILWHAPTGTLTAPVLAHEGWIIAGSTTALYALRSSDGGKVWSREAGAQQAQATIEGDNLYVPLQTGALLALDVRTGSQRWMKQFAGAPTEVLAFADRMYFGSADKFFYCLKSRDGARDWRTRIGTTLRGRPVANATRVFVAGMDNVVRAFDRRSGAERWHAAVAYRPTGVILIGSVVLVPGTSAELHGFDAATGKPAGQISLAEALPIPPAFSSSGKDIVMGAVTGSLSEQWKLLLTEPAPPMPPSINIEALTTVPGASVPVRAPAPPG
jgi:outer membrane protein assembly factor BamB